MITAPSTRAAPFVDASDETPTASGAAARYYSPGFTLRRRATSLGRGVGLGRTAAARYRWRPTSRPGRDLDVAD
jgi:hypothetical protein